MSATRMDQLLLKEFTDIQLRKTKLVYGEFHDEERMREIIQNVIADTYLLLNGDVPMDEWKKQATEEGWPVPVNLVPLPEDYGETAG